MGFSSKLIVGGLAAVAAVAYYTQKRHSRSGEGYVTIAVRLPSDARRWWGQTREHAALALEDGKAAARQRDAELARQLASAGG